MKNNQWTFFLFIYIGFSLAAYSQGKSKIILKDKTIIQNIKVWNIYSNKIEYEENESLHDLLVDRIARIETDTAILSFDDTGQLFSRPYDWIIKANNDTVFCVISQLGGNYIYYYPKGKENRSYIPESSIKKYQVYKPEPVKKLEPGSAPYTPQGASADSMKPSSPAGDISGIIPTPDTANDTVQKTSIEKADSSLSPPAEIRESLPPSSTVISTLPQQSDICYESYIRGEQDANRKSETIWGTSSFCLTGCFGGIPVSAISLIALNSKKKPKNIPPGMDEKCYLLGYQNQQVKRRVYNASIGGLVASVVLLGLFYGILVVNGQM